MINLIKLAKQTWLNERHKIISKLDNFPAVEIIACLECIYPYTPVCGPLC